MQLADTVGGITKGEEARRIWQWSLSPMVAVSCEPPATNDMSLSDLNETLSST